MCIFPNYSFEIESMHKLSAVYATIYEAIRTNPSYSISDIEAKQNQMVFAKKNDTMLLINSFSPTVVINFYQEGFCTKIIVSFKLRRSIRIILSVYLSIALAIEMSFLFLMLKKELVTSLLLFLPLVLFLFAITISYVGLKLSSIQIEKNIVSAIRRLEDSLPDS